MVRDREIITIQVGKAGNNIAHEFWRDLVEEHGISYQDNSEDRGKLKRVAQSDFARSDVSSTPMRDDDVGNLGVFFNEGQKDRYVPRAILMDLNMIDLEQIAAEPLGELYRPENIIGNDEGSGNCYAKAFHTEGPDLADQCLENVRKEVEKCNALQGIQFTHSVSGGTGSGLTGLLLNVLRDYIGGDSGKKCIMQAFTLVPRPDLSDVLIEPYNAALGIQDLLEYTDQVFVYDNRALQDVCLKSKDLDPPRMIDMNDIIARCMSGLASCLRYHGAINADLHKMHTNLVPFHNAHFCISSLAPLSPEANKSYRNVSVLDLAQQMLSKDNVTVKCDPLRPEDRQEGLFQARFLASWASWRGPVSTQEVDKIMWDLQAPRSRWEKFFPDWIPNAIASNYTKKAHCEAPNIPSVVFVSNSTAVHEVFDLCSRNWDLMFKKKAYLHHYEENGIAKQDLEESRNMLQYISDSYCEYARWEDSLFEKKADETGPNERATINEKACENSEHKKIAQELQNIADGKMYIEQVKDGVRRR